jgi:predicted dehydrogenase
MTVISIAMLSRWHVHASDYARQATQNPNLEIRAVWDEVPERGEAWAQELGVPFVSDLTQVLSDPSIDAVIIDTPTTLHKDVMIQAAEHGKHIFSEKVLAVSVADCEEVLKAVEASGVKFMLSLPRLSDPYYLFAQQAVDEGWIGKLTTVRCRLAHNGAVPSDGRPHGWLPEHFFNPEQCGGGALIDLGAHPIYLTNRLGGQAVAVTARLSSFLNYPVDDNAAVIVEYESGALGMIETGFVSSGSPFLLELYGTEGALIVEDAQVRVRGKHFGADGWKTVENLPERGLSPMEQWVEMILHDKTPNITVQDMLWLTKINEAAALSHREGRRVALK